MPSVLIARFKCVDFRTFRESNLYKISYPKLIKNNLLKQKTRSLQQQTDLLSCETG